MLATINVFNNNVLINTHRVFIDKTCSEDAHVDILETIVHDILHNYDSLNEGFYVTINFL
jgi:uncharacterized glyoxalase superfamily metalloenzyme YdcJ